MLLSSTIRLVIADDYPICRVGLMQSIDKKKNNYIQIVGEADNGESLIQEVKKSKPDVVLTDIRMPTMNGIEASRIINKQFPKISVIALSMSADPDVIYEMFETGAKGYVSKNAGIREIEQAIETVYSGEMYYCSTCSISLIKKIGISKFNQFKKNENSCLALKEIQLIKLICLQLPAKEISGRMKISIRTVEEYIHSIKEKIGAKNLVGIALYGVRNNIVGLDEI